MTSPTSVSPLTEAQSTSLDEYFSRKPPYDATTLARIKAEFRRMREQWAKADAMGTKVPRAKKAPKPAASTSTTLDIFSSSPEETPDVAS